MTPVLAKSQTLIRGLSDDEGTVKALIKLGADPDVNQYKISGQTEGQQIFRTQYDVAVDGTEYILTAGAGQGTYTFTIFEGPFDCDQSQGPVFAARLSRMDFFENRTIVVVIPFGTTESAFFSGLIVGSTINQKMDNTHGSYTVMTQISTVGRWR